MDVAIVGAHGQVARSLLPRLVARGDRVRGLVRSPSHVADIEADGAEAVICDLETAEASELDAALAGAGAVVFAAGAGPGSGPERKWTVDYGAARKLIDAAGRLGIGRYVMLSSVGTDDPPQDDEVFSVYLRAKARADADLRDAGLRHTIVRPVSLTDDAGGGAVTVGAHVDRTQIARADVAAVLAAVLPDARTFGRTFEVATGSTPIDEAMGLVEQIPPDGAG